MDILTESPEDKALMESIRTETAPQETPPPEPPPAPAPEPVVAPPVPAPAAAPVAAPERLVPQQALHEERQRRQQLERELAELRKPAELDETQDPIGTIGKLKQEINEFKSWQREQAEQATLAQQIGSRIQSYAKDNPDYYGQYQFLQKSRVNELRALGHNEQSIAQTIHAEEMQLGRTALQNDLDPGDVIAKLATARGWQKAAPAAGTPAAVPVAPVAPSVPTISEAERHIDRIDRGQRAASGGGSSGGAGPTSEEMTVERLANLNGAAFDKAFSKWKRQEMDAGRWR